MKVECDFCGAFVDESIYRNEGCPGCGGRSEIQMVEES